MTDSTPTPLQSSNPSERPELIGGPEKRKLSLAPWTKRWEEIYAEHRERIVGVLGDVALAVHHIGSTSVPGLGAKPIVDMLLVVADVEAEGSYLPGLLGAGYELRVRERGHRMVRTAERDVHVHVHVLSEGDPEIGEYLLFRDQLRVDESDRVLYESVKRGLLEGEWADMNDYAEAKSQVVADIKRHARLGRAERLLVVGDSLAYGRCDVSGGWAQLLRVRHQGVDEVRRRMWNVACPGGLVRDVVDGVSGLVERLGVDVVLVQAGINDVAAGASAQEVLAELVALVEVIEGVGARAVVFTPLWFDSVRAAVEFGVVIDESVARQLREDLVGWGLESRRDVVDVWPVLEGRGELLVDGLHPGAQGHRLIFEALVGGSGVEGQ